VTNLSTGRLALAEATNVGLGTTENAATFVDEPVGVRLISAHGTRKVVANGAISLGALVYCAAAGKVGSSGTVPFGVALEAATADNDIIEVLHYGADPGVVRSLRTRVTTANVNAGATLLPAVANRRYRLVDASMIAIGGNAAGATAIRITGTQSAAAVQLVSNTVAALTQSARVLAGVTANSSVLADGASFNQCDANTAITITANGTLTTATHIDVLLTYVLES
jgi:predicted pyridoxine 5'-phosphate oxidase superfamily flavin-nucleotide-binding protein